MSRHYMTKEGVSIVCRNCLYWGNTNKLLGGNMGSCGNANQKNRMTCYFNTCANFWPKHQYRK